MKISLLLLLSFFTPFSAFAELGSSPLTETVAKQKFDATLTETDHKSLYSTQTFNSPIIRITEYISNSSGKVFGVAWQGLSHPDPELLFGSYGTHYKSDAAKAPKVHGKRAHHYESNGLVVNKSAMMRNFRGNAFLKADVPSGVSLNEIK